MFLINLLDKKSRLSWSEAIEIIRSRFELASDVKIRIFSSLTGSEVVQTQFLSELSYVVTLHGKDLLEIHTGDSDLNTLMGPFEIMNKGPPPLLGQFLGNATDLMKSITAGYTQMEAFSFVITDHCLKTGFNHRFAYMTLPFFRGALVLNADPDFTLFVTKNEDLFDKTLPRGPLQILRELVTPEGLFTNGSEMDSWDLAHRILTPAFSLDGMKEYFPIMVSQMRTLLKGWEVLPLGTPLDITDYMTRMTLDTIGLAGFDYDFGMIADPSSMHPFVDAMVATLGGTQDILKLLTPWDYLLKYTGIVKRVTGGKQVMLNIVKEVAERRLRLGTRKKDLLDLMLHVSDERTGEKLPLSNIYDQLITFLVAGHETTSGLLSFAWYLLSQNPEVEERAIREVDEIVGRDPSVGMEWKQVGRLKYLDMILKETLRLFPTAPAFNKYALKDIKFGNYFIPKGQDILNLTFALHRNPKCWKDPLRFDPERWSPERSHERHPGAYFPFGSGKRSCIGLQFALIESKVVMAMILQRMRLRCAPDYKFKLVSLLTIKPGNLRMIMEPREPSLPLPLPHQSFPSLLPSKSSSTMKQSPSNLTLNHPSTSSIIPSSSSFSPSSSSSYLFIFYAGNMGSCRSLSQDLRAQCLSQQKPSDPSSLPTHTSISPLDDFMNELPSIASLSLTSPESVVRLVFIVSTYNGHPPDNAKKFQSWVSSQPSTSSLLSGLSYSVFGCGNSQWSLTFQSFPTEVDSQLERLGGVRVIDRGSADADGDFDEAWEEWTERFWAQWQVSTSSLAKTQFGESSPRSNISLQVSVLPSVEHITAPPSFRPTFTVTVNRELLQLAQSSSPRSTRHIELTGPRHPLPLGGYRAGDHFEVWPINIEEDTAFLLRKLDLSPSTLILIQASHLCQDTSLPLNQPLSLHMLLSECLDLSAPLTRKSVQLLAPKALCPPDRKKLLDLSSSNESFKASDVGSNKMTLISLWRSLPSISLDLSDLIQILPPHKPRYYSISSSPLLDSSVPEEVSLSLTVSHLQWTSKEGQTRTGLCSSYLKSLSPGSSLRGYIRPAPEKFHLPSDPAVPLILVGPGTGVAPLRGFIRERLAQSTSPSSFSTRVGPILLFFGCRDQSEDCLYREEWETIQHEKSIELFVFTALSRDPLSPKRYVQDLIREQGSLEDGPLRAALRAGGKVFVCGDARSMAPDVRRAFSQVLSTMTHIQLETGEEKLQKMVSSGMYVEDIWASN